MISQVRYEISKVSIKSLGITLGATFAMLSIGAVGAAMQLADQADAGLLAQDDIARSLMTNAFVGLLFATIYGALLMTTEHRHANLSATFLQTPNRNRVIVSKAAVAALVGIVIGLISVLSVAGIGAIVFSQRDLSMSWNTSVSLTVVGTVLVSVLAGPWGLALGAVFRRGSTALLVIIGYTLLIETVLVETVPKFARFLPGGAQEAITRDLEFPARLNMGVGVALFVAYVVVALSVACRRTQQLELA